MSEPYETARAAIADIRRRAENSPDAETLSECISEIGAIRNDYGEHIDKGLSREEYVKIVDSAHRAEQYLLALKMKSEKGGVENEKHF